MPFAALGSPPSSCYPSEEDPVTAKPQVVPRGDGASEDVHPHRWGITIAQCKALMQHCRGDPRWDPSNSVHTLVQDFIIPMTAGTGLGYALLQNQAEPKEVNVMTSHAWTENAEEFFETLERSVDAEDVMFICCLSLYQCEDGAGPSINEQIGSRAEDSPFRRVLENIAAHRKASWLARTWHMWRWLHWTLVMLAMMGYFGVVSTEQCLPVAASFCAVGRVADYNPHLYHGGYCMLPRLEFRMREVTTRSRHVLLASGVSFCCSAALLFLLRLLSKQHQAYRGFLLVVPNYECDLYARLWCVYEVYIADLLGVPCWLARTLASAGCASCESATCSLREDQERITQEIKSHGSFELVDAAIGRIMRNCRHRFLRSVLQGLLPYLTMAVAVPAGDWGPTKQLFGTILCTGIDSILLASLVLMLGTYVLVKQQAGKVTYRSGLGWAGAVIVASLSLRAVDAFYLKEHALPLRKSGVRDFPPFHHFFTFATASGGFSLASVIILEWLCSGRFICWRHRRPAVKVAMPLVLAVFSLYATSVPRVEQYQASAIWYLLFRLIPYTGFFVYFWTAAARWGVRLVRA